MATAINDAVAHLNPSCKFVENGKIYNAKNYAW